MKIKEVIARLAIAKVNKPKNLGLVKKSVTAGEYDVDFTARFQGRIQVGDAYNQKIVAKADPWKLLGVALSKLNNVTVASLVKEAETSSIDGDAIKESAQGAVNQIKAPTDTICAGKTTGSVDLSVESAKVTIVN